jgi:hypothetical protein
MKKQLFLFASQLTRAANSAEQQRLKAQLARMTIGR